MAAGNEIDPASNREPKLVEQLNYSNPRDETRRRRIPISLWISTPVLLFLVISTLMPNTRTREPATKIKCASNLRQIGQAILLYANDHHGQYPDRLDLLLKEEEITADTFICPKTPSIPATGPTTQAVCDQMLSGDHLDYVYVGRGLSTRTVTDDTVVAFEPLGNHGDGMNVLFGDGHAEFILSQAGKLIEARAAAGVFPIALP